MVAGSAVYSRCPRALARGVGYQAANGDVLNARGHRRGRHRAQAGNSHQAARHFVASSHRGDGSIAARDLLIQSMQLTHERGERCAHAGRNRLVAFRFDDPRQVTGVFEPLRRDDPNLGQMPAGALISCVRCATSISRAL
jgi:hypothetical protein